ncbi:MAG TPA: aspartyl-phosphate phosphatase Spo0E family protein [Candidatus Udaeobacter sp.]|nr:aspartyl-phosphate phosphatase Spo0E family protein [Candidatus Udaeobacter sp.]
MDKLLKRIEEARHKMHELAERYGLTAPQVVEQSQKLDGLLGEETHDTRIYR